MPKKILIMILIVSMMLTSVSAQTEQSLRDVSVEFCNTGADSQKFDLGEIESGDTIGICLSMRNRSDAAIKIKFGFVDGVLTADGEHVACRAESDERVGFGAFVMPRTSKVITIPAQKTIKRRSRLKIPTDFQGVLHGCMTYFIPDSKGGDGVTVFTRKARVITARVSGVSSVPEPKPKPKPKPKPNPKPGGGGGGAGAAPAHQKPQSVFQKVSKLIGSIKSSGKKVAQLNDVDAQAWYSPFVAKLTDLEVISGYPDGSFRPAKKVNRAELAKMVVTAFQLSTDDDTSAFRDVPNDAWYAKYAAACKKRGIINGYPNGAFRGAQVVNRAEAVVVLAQAAQLELDTESSHSFSDVSEVSWYQPFVEAAVRHDIISGYPDGTFRPGDSVSRAEMAKMIANTLESF